MTQHAPSNDSHNLHKEKNHKKLTWAQAVRQRRALQFFPQNRQATHTEQQWEDKFRFMGCKCHYCNCKLSIEEAERDHSTPLCRGGSDRIDNIVPACKPCNLMKAWRTEAEFIADLPRLLKRATAQRAIYKPKGGVAFEEKVNEPGLLKKMVNERERVSWAWRNPA